MKIEFDDKVRKHIPELKIYTKKLNNYRLGSIPLHIDRNLLTNLILTKSEISEYKNFRRKISGKELLAAERLKKLYNSNNLPKPDLLTSLIIQASYYTGIPINVFSNDDFNLVNLRFSVDKEVFKTNNNKLLIKPHSLIADTDVGILGVFGIKSSIIGKIKPESKNITILSFGCSLNTKKKSKDLVGVMYDILNINL